MVKGISSNIASLVASGRLSRRVRRLALAALLALTIIESGHVATAGRAVQSEGASIIGVVQDDRNAPLADVKVTLSSQDYSATARTQADGKFEFRALKPGQYNLTAEAISFLKKRIALTIARPDETLNPVIKLNFSSLHVAVFDANSQPLKGVTVTLYKQERGAATEIASRTSTDESGDAYFGRMPPDSYQLTAVLRGYEEYRNEVFISSGITTELPLQLLVAPVIPINEKLTERYGIPGLPSKNVRAVFQDSEGWLWFGTDKGIARFDGAEFRSSAAPGSTYKQLAGEDVRWVAEDRSGVIWLATPRGIRRINKDGSEIGGALGGRDARHISVDSRGNIWIATTSGVFKFDGKDYTSLDESQGLPSSDVRATAEDRRGRIWIATAKGVATLDGDKIVPFDPEIRAPSEAPREDNRREAERRESASTTAAALNDARFIFVGKDGTVWLASGKGVLSFDGARSSNVAIAGLQSSNDPSAGGAGVVAISQDRRDRLWFALSEGGALLYDPARGESQRISLLDRDRVAAIFTGREGSVWFGTENGAVRADFYSFVNFTTSRGLPDTDVRAVVEVPSSNTRSAGALWIATAAGVVRMEGERFVPVEEFRPNVDVRAVTFDGAGEAWFATVQGVFHSSEQTLTQLNEGNGLASNNVRWAMTIADGSAMLFATAKGVSLLEKGEFRSLEGLAGYDVRHAFEDPDGLLWFATARGLVRFDPRTEDTLLIDSSRGLADNDTRSVCRFNGELLVATRAGVQVYNDRSVNPPAFTTFDGEPANALFVDSDNYLWVGTDSGKVEKFTVLGNHLISKVYSGENYALTGSHINSITEDRDGQIWIATDKGAVRHSPRRSTPLAQVSVEVDGRAVTPAEEVYHLSYGRQRLTFRFTAVSMGGSNMSEQVRCLYRVNSDKGDGPWTLLPMQPGAVREVNIFSLDEGVHSFELIALNRDLYGRSAPAAKLMLNVGQPFWKRWWFYTLAFVFVGLAAAALVAARRMRDREYILPKELRSYVAIEPNPYIVGNPIRAENMFYGREDDFRYVRTKLEGTNQGVIIVFCGDRRVGKSSILYQVLNGRLGERFITVFVDMQEMVIASDSEFFSRVSRLITEAVTRALSPPSESDTAESVVAPSGSRGDTGTGFAASPRPRLVVVDETSRSTVAASAKRSEDRVIPFASVSLPVFDGCNPYPVFIDFLDEVLRATGDRTLLILIDEYELMEAKVDEGKLSPELFTFLAGIMDNKERLAFIFTGSRRLDERDKKYWRELLRRSLFRKVSFLSEKDALRLITEPVEGRVVYGRGVVEELYRLTAGQPFYTQVLCQNTVDYMNEHEQNWVTGGDLKHVLADIIDNPLPQMTYTWDGLSDDEKLVLSLLAEALPNGSGSASARELRTAVEVNQYPVNLSENTIRVTLEELFRREMVEKDAGNGFCFKIDLLRLWIRRSHSIWQVVKEVRTL